MGSSEHYCTLSTLLALRGEKDLAFEWLEKAYEQQDKGLTQLKTDYRLDSLRSDARFRDLLRRVNLPQ